MRKRLFATFILAFFISIRPSFLGLAGEASRGQVYTFHEHLSEAEAFVVRRTTALADYEGGRIEFITGQWQKNQFVFPVGAKETPVGLEKRFYDGREREGILFQPREYQIKALRFFNVPTGSNLSIEYGIDDDGASLVGDAIVYLVVRIGRKEMARIHVPNEKGWHRRHIPFGVLSFLRRPIAVTFEVTCDREEKRHFSFHASLYS